MKNIINIYSLSPLQEGMLFHSLYDEDDENSQSYFSQMKLRLNGKLDIAMFEKAWKEVIKRHDILRTKFLFGKTEKNVQVVYRTVPFNVDYTDWRSFSREEQESKIEEFLRLDKQRGFDWDDVPLMRVMLIHNDIDEYTMVWSHHHILLDGWSVSLVVKELFHIYNALCQEATITLPPAQQYGKYIHWLRSRSKDSQNTKEFWATKLKGFTEPTQFNLAAPMKGFDQQGYEEYWWHLSKDLTHSLNHIVKEHKITLNTIIQSAWALLLSYYSGTKDVLFGATSSGRPADLPGVENMVGLFISTLPVRAQIPDDEVLLEWMKNFQSQLMEIRQYEYSSLVDIQGVSEVPRGTPLFESLFVFENYPVGEMESITDLRIEEIQGKEQANYPFVLSAGPGEQIPFKIMFDRSKFDEDTIHRISGQLTYVLDQIAKNPNVTISSIQFLTEKETKQILVDWNDTAGEYPREKTIHELFEEQVSLKPDGIALETEDGAVTYRELNESANQIAHYLIEQGIEIGDPIGICMNRSLEEIASMLGILKVGGAYVGLDPEYPEERLKHIVEETEMPLLLTTSQSGLDEAAYDVDIVNIDLLDLPEEKTNIFREGISATALSNIIYTSGSTGKPKGVCVPHRGVVRLVKGETYVPITSDDVFLHVASISFDATTLEVWSSLLNGARLVLLPTRNASLQDYENVIQKYNVSILWLTAGLFNVFVDHNLQALKGVKYILIGGETVSVPHVRKAMEALEGTEIINGYGPSENTVFTTCHRIEEADLERPSIPIGRPIANTEVYVLDENQQPVPVGVIGELYAGGDGLAIGYMNRPELTAERFIPHPFKQGSGEKLYRTGDLVRYLPDGKIEFIGRADHQVKIRGFRIELGEIEVVLKQYPDVRDAVVTVVEDELGDKRLSAYIVTDQSLDVKKIKNHLKEKLPNYMIPDFVTLLAELPLTRNGKVDRAALPAPEIVEGEEYIAPRTPTEEIVSGIWSGVLGVEKVGSNDSFFDLGGHSLLATTTVSKLQNAFGVEVTIKDLFENPTVEQLANHLDQMLSGENKIDFPEIEIIDKEKFIPLSYAQQRLWFISQLTSQSSIYNIPWALKLNGKLQVDALEKSINDMVVRHESLRTIIKEENGQARQIVVPPRDSKLEINDLSNMEEIIRLKEVERITEEEATKDFDLSVGPLFQVKLLKLSDNEHIFLCTMHHIISDAWSMGIFLEELFELYRSYCSGTEAKLPPLNYQYTDFSVWQRKWLNNEVLENQLKYWKNELSGKLPVLQLPSDYPRPAQQTFNGALLTERVPTELVHKLRKLSKQEGTTLFMTVLAAYQGFLSRYTNQDDIIVGSPIANRNHASIEGIIGFFVNSLVIRTNVSTEMTFTDLMSKVKEKALNAYLNQDIPFERIVDEVVEERSLSYSPIFQTMLVFQNKASKIPKGLNIDLEPISVQLPFAKFDLTVIIEEEDDEFTLAFEYNTDLFKEGTIKRLSRNFLHWLESVVVNPKEKLTNLPLTAQEEEHQLLIEWNKTEKAFLEHQSIPEWFEAKVQETPDAIAVVFNDNSLTYKQLNDRANRLAHFLLEKGIDPEEPVGICLGKSLEMIIAILGVLKSGAAYVPLDPEYPSERLEYMLNDAQISHVITGKEYSSKLNDYTSQIYITGQNDVLKDYSKENPNVITSPDQLAYIIYTSGSTGNPKGVMIEHRGVTNLATQQIDFQKITAESRVIQFASFSFDASVFEIFSTFMAGASLYIGEKEEILPGPDLTGFLNKHKITHATLPPTALVWLEEKELPYLEVIVSAGSACTLELAREWSKNKTFINGYGPTETTVCATYFQCDPSLDLPSVPIGRPVPNTEVYILDQNLQPVPTGVVGELYIGGKGLARGYINNTKLTKESFISHTFRNGKRIRLYKTGDLVRYLPDGNIEYIGRKDHQVKIRGFRVELGEVESILAKYPGVKDVVVTARKDYKYKEARLVAYLVTDEQLDERAVRRYVKEHLPTFMVPSDIVKLDEFPLTPNGKVDLNKLPEPEGQADDKNYAAPTNEVEEILVSIWENVLNKRKIGINDNFFELGGDSILSIQIIAQAKQKGLSLTAKQLFEHQTIAELAQVAKRVTGISAQQDAVIGGFPLTPIQSWFFEKNSDNPHHWNQSMALKVEEPLDRELLEKCFQIIQQHHDILRLRFNRNSSGEWKPYISGPDQTVPLTVYDITNIPEDQLEDFVMEKENETQSSLNLLEGPVWKAVYFKHETQTGRLFWVIHHLAVDGVSWRILMEDVNDIYLQLQDGKEVKLPLKTSSYKEWAHKLLDYAVSLAIQSSKDYWLTANENETLTTIPIDFPSGNNTEKYTDKVTVSLSEEETELLFQEFLHSYRINVEEVLLTSLVHSIAEWTGSDQLVVNIEGHGREEILENLDLTRTVGWFTSLFPVKLKKGKDIRNTLRDIKETIRSMPNKGVDYGILRYLNKETSDILKNNIQPSISFNYLGQFNNDNKGDSIFTTSEELSNNQDVNMERFHLIDVVSLISDNKLQLTLLFSNDMYKKSTMTNIANSLRRHLLQLLESKSGEFQMYTPSDFPLCKLSQEKIDELIGSRTDVEVMYPLSPLQKGMLFHTYLNHGQGEYISQLGLVLNGELHKEIFKNAWEQVINQHLVLRTAFKREKEGEILQLVYKNVSVSFSYKDWSHLSEEEQSRKYEKLEDIERKKEFNLEEPPLMRILLIKVGPEKHRVLWTHHHVILDGWSIPLVLKDVFAYYEADLKGYRYRPHKISSFEQYIAWLGKKETHQSEQYWREQLKGVKSPTLLLSNSSNGLEAGV
ncbi:non-ribosomal peptide synthetase [Caldifermentibacillus hisashii]|uniref:non-ribosomal peptide synthetase n=1 Tax=Caldifermentibacillus hisashii TaxID=996558 RepID=UPI002DF82E58|nr:non-ribosomal peptide synthetase [Caldifermentibacillus hisashii]MEC5271177.1 amino acid adenylation domain-containing protein [Caldifermentibacillus hisashii]